MATSETQKAYSRGYGRAMSRSADRVKRVLEIARGYKEACTREEALRCRSCQRWERGGESCLWGYCRGDFEYQAGEGKMWADTYVGEKEQRRIVTQENFGCINWLPKQTTL